jgi:hypothetical protein
MKDFAIIFQVLVGLLALFFIFLTYLNTKSWRWVHVTATFLVFVATMIFCFYAAMVMRTRIAWVGYHDKLEKQVAEESKNLERTVRGDPLENASENPSVVGLREELGRVILDRGRVWRGCIPAINADGTVTVATSPPQDPNLPALGPPKKNNIQVKTVLHAFREGPPNEQGLIVPVGYIGEFQATAVTDDRVTLAVTMPPLSREQIAFAQAPLQGQTGPPTWVLYENCPVDGHEWFAGLTVEELRRLIPAQATGLTPEQYQRLIDSYLRDGKEATPNDPPENVWVEVKFVQPYEVTVDAATINSIDTEPFNLEGQAVFNRLRRAAPGEEPAKVQFGPGEGQIPTAVLDIQTADSLVAQGICEKTGQPIYRRKLSDYERRLHATSSRIAELNSRRRLLDLDNKALIASTEKANQHAQLLEELKTKLDADLEKGKQERDELKKYEEAVRARLVDVQNQLSQLYRSNKVLSRDLEETSRRLSEEIERRTREATAMAR